MASGIQLVGVFRAIELPVSARSALRSDVPNHRLSPLTDMNMLDGVNVIVAAGMLPARAAKATTTSIPIVFSVGADPVQFGLVASLNRPGGNLTGVNGFIGELGAKGVALLHDLVPSTVTLGFLRKQPWFELGNQINGLALVEDRLVSI